MAKSAIIDSESLAQAEACESLQHNIRDAVRLARIYAAAAPEAPVEFGETLEDLANDLMDICDSIAARARADNHDSTGRCSEMASASSVEAA